LEIDMQMEGKPLVDLVLASTAWAEARDWGVPRPGHPEGTIGRHVSEQILPFIDHWYGALPEYWDLVALAHLHDIGKPQTQYVHGRLQGDSHSVLSARIATALGASSRIATVILHNDRGYSYWRRLVDQKDGWCATQWTEERRLRFVSEFGNPALDLRLLVLFTRADNACRRPAVRDESHDPVTWLENRLLEERLIADLPREGRG
jgi:hypothetical protein